MHRRPFSAKVTGTFGMRCATPQGFYHRCPLPPCLFGLASAVTVTGSRECPLIVGRACARRGDGFRELLKYEVLLPRNHPPEHLHRQSDPLGHP
mmetsp:Transcript_29467/g.67768  ORF Transcript_29467/g.67768 Transcript_29467/m.67768 type:complete len:94 (-) Transcript_29467:1262-1543(-)